MLKFMASLRRVIDITYVKILYMGKKLILICFFYNFFQDTDSIFFGMSCEFDDCVLPGMQKEWEKVKNE